MRTSEIRRFLQGAAVAAAIAVAAPSVASAQGGNATTPANDQAGTGYSQTAQTTNNDEGHDWGWLGLLGLAGLLGLRRRDHVDRVDRTDRTTTRGPMT